MPTVEIKTKLTKQQVKDILHDLPKILAGKKWDRWGLRDVFYGVLAHELYTRIGKAFEVKATGLSDSLGNSWKPLAKRTLDHRKAPKLIKKYPLALQNLIHRISDKMFDTLKPGTFDGSKYKPRRNQIFHHAHGTLTLGSKLDYASYAHEKRPLWPEDMSPWVDEAITIAIEKVMIRLKEVIQ